MTCKFAKIRARIIAAAFMAICSLVVAGVWRLFVSAGGAVLENGGSGHLLLYVVLGCTDTTFASPLGLFGLSFFFFWGGAVFSPCYLTAIATWINRQTEKKTRRITTEVTTA
jgi:hypothetical protein